MYTSNEFKAAWEQWKKHKVQISQFGYTSISEDMALSALFKKSHGVEQLAIDSIYWSIEKNWAAVYIKTKQDGHGKNFSGSQSVNGSAGTQGNSKVEAYRNWGRK